MKVGLIDLGSNSIRLVIYQVKQDQLIKLINLKQHAQSVLYVKDAKMTQEGIELIVTVLDELIEVVRTYDVDYFKIFATASLRNIENSKEAVGAIESMIHYPIEVLSDIEETMYGFEGVLKQKKLPIEGLLIDVGGGSIELTYFKDNKPIHTHSLPIGSLTFYHQHVFELIPTLSEQTAMRVDIRNKFNSIEWLNQVQVDTVVGIGGSARALLRLAREIDKKPIRETSSVLSKSSVHYLSHLDIHASKSILKATPNRLITIIPAAIMIDELMMMIQATTFQVSSYGVREGYLFKRLLQSE